MHGSKATESATFRKGGATADPIRANCNMGRVSELAFQIPLMPQSSTNPDAKLGAAMTSLRFLLSISRRCFD